MLAKKSFRLDISRGAALADRRERASHSREACFSAARWIGEKYEAFAFTTFSRATAPTSTRHYPFLYKMQQTMRCRIFTCKFKRLTAR